MLPYYQMNKLFRCSFIERWQFDDVRVERVRCQLSIVVDSICKNQEETLIA